MTGILSEMDMYKAYQILPFQVKEQVSNYMQFILAQYHLNIKFENEKAVNPSSHKRVLGGLEGKLWMSEDFDEPLADFNEYMK